jgi:DNA-directed RNA polymerase I, II, and III subunit RPABC3
MSSQNILFEDSFKINSIDKEGKVFDKVSRIDGETDETRCKISLDVNSELYQMSSDAIYSLVLAKSVYNDGTPSPNNFSYEVYQKKNSLIDKYDYVMYGKIFKYSEENDGKVSIYISFGGLLLGITGEPKNLVNLKMDERVYLLIRRT